MGAFCRRIPVSMVFFLVFPAALGLYALTMAPSLTQVYGGVDGAELAVAVYTLGIPHPTGYPTYVLLAQAFRVLPWGDLAGRLNLFSAVSAALAVGLSALSAAELLRGEAERVPALVTALTSGVTLAVAGLFWSQALITEVYGLHTLFLVLACWLLLRWRRRGGVYLILAGLTTGLGLGNHLSLLFLLPGAVVFLLLSRRPLSRREAVLSLGLLLAGLAVYLYLPLRAAADPWLNWGDPRDWAAFWAHASGQAYQSLLFRVPWLQFAQRLISTAGLLLDDLAPWGLALGLAGCFLLARRDRAATLLVAVPAVLGLLLAASYGGADSYVHLLPLYLAWALWAGVAAGEVSSALHQRFGGRVAAVAFLVPLLGLIMVAWHGPERTLRADPGPLPRQEQTLAKLPGGSLLLTARDEETFPLWYAQVVEGVRPDLALVNVRLLEWPWYRRQLPARYPGLVLPAAPSSDGWLRAFLEANESRPAYTMDDTWPLPAGYRFRKDGPAYRLVPP